MPTRVIAVYVSSSRDSLRNLAYALEERTWGFGSLESVIPPPAEGDLLLLGVRGPGRAVADVWMSGSISRVLVCWLTGPLMTASTMHEPDEVVLGRVLYRWRCAFQLLFEAAAVPLALGGPLFPRSSARPATEALRWSATEAGLPRSGDIDMDALLLLAGLGTLPGPPEGSPGPLGPSLTSAEPGAPRRTPFSAPAGPHPSGSHEQREAEPLILAAVAKTLGIVLAPRRLRLPGGSVVDVDGVSDDPRVLVEVYAHQGPLRGAQPKKLAQDAFKLMTVREAVLPDARLILALSDEQAAAGIRRGWMAEALDLWGIEVVVVALDKHVVAGLVAAQKRQTMINPPAPENQDLRPTRPETTS